MITKITEYIEAHEQEMIEDVKTLVSINSERMEAKPEMPYGEGVAAVFAEAEKLLMKHGMTVQSKDHRVIYTDLTDLPSRLDILAHLDVVPGGTDFTVTDPFTPIVKDGRIYGRGSADDKGPAIAALYAMKVVRDLGFPLSGNCRLILGGDEECGSSCIEHYYRTEVEAPMTFSPDAGFPLINVEKGRLGMCFTAEMDQGEHILLKSIDAGGALNVVPGKAQAVLSSDVMSEEELRTAAVRVSEKTGVSFEITLMDNGDFGIAAVGESAHASLPENGNNALTALLTLLAGLPLTETLTGKLQALCRLFPHGVVHGEGLGVSCSDEESGELTLTLTVCHFDGNGLTAGFDSRTPICANEENMGNVVRARLTEAGFVPDDSRMSAPHSVPADSDFVRTLLSCYTEVTGEEGEPMSIGGGTYVHELARGVAFGCEEEGIDNHMHGADEFMRIDTLKKSAVIFALAIARLCR